MDIPCQVSEASAMATSQMDIVVQRLVSYLSKTQQVSNKHCSVKKGFSYLMFPLVKMLDKACGEEH